MPLDLSQADSLAREAYEKVHAAQSAPDLNAWLKDTTPAYHWEWAHLRLIIEHLEAQARGDLKHLMVLIPPQHGKTESVSVRYPVWRLERDPSTRVILAAYNQRYVEKIARKARRIAVQRGKLRFAHDRNAASEWELAGGGGFFAVGIGGGVTGSPAELAIIDDPIKSREDADSEIKRDSVWEWYVDELSTRVSEGGSKLLVMTPWHQDDLRGRILASAEAPLWTVLQLPAISLGEGDPLGRAEGVALCPARRSLEWLENQRALNPHSFEALYQCSPTAKSGSTFLADRIERVDRSVIRKEWVTVLAWDLGATEKGDWTAGVQLWRDPEGYIYVDVVRFRDEPFARNGRILSEVEYRKPDKVVVPEDPGAAGVESAKNLLRLLIGWNVDTARPDRKKTLRAEPFASQVNGGMVRLINGEFAGEYDAELRAFPNGRHDDMVDASSDALAALAEMTEQTFSPLLIRPQPGGIAQYAPSGLSGANNIVAGGAAFRQFGAPPSPMALAGLTALRRE